MDLSANESMVTLSWQEPVLTALLGATIQDLTQLRSAETAQNVTMANNVNRLYLAFDTSRYKKLSLQTESSSCLVSTVSLSLFFLPACLLEK